MVAIPLGESWSSLSENVEGLRTKNMYAIDNPVSPTGISFVSRPTLTSLTSIGSGPIAGIWRQDDTFDGDWLVASGDRLYRYKPSTDDTTLIAEIPGTDYCQFAGTADRAIIVRNGTAYSYDGTAVSIIVMPDDVPGYDGYAAPVASVACINSTFILTVKDSQRFYWIDPGIADPDPLDFASAERQPDAISSVQILMDEIWFLGTEGPEVWSTDEDPDLPFVRINGRVYSDGCLSPETVAKGVYNNLPCLVWVTRTGTVVLGQGAVQKISDENVEEVLRTATNVRAWSFRHNRHDFYILATDQGTFVFDLQKNRWYDWGSYELSYWRAHLGLMDGPVAYAGDAITGDIWKLSESYDDNGDPVTRVVAGMVPVMGAFTKCSSVAPRVNSGWSPAADLEPFLELRYSDDQGSSFSEWQGESLGKRGEYYSDVVFRSLGTITRPGRIFEFRFSAPARFRIDYALMNEA